MIVFRLGFAFAVDDPLFFPLLEDGTLVPVVPEVVGPLLVAVPFAIAVVDTI